MQLALQAVPGLERRRRREPALIVRQHVRHVDVRPAVVVHVRDIEAHRRQTDVRHLQLEPLGEGAVAVVDVEVVALEEVVRHVDVGPAVAVHIAHHDPQAQTDFAAVDAGRGAHIDEMAAVVAIQVRATQRVTLVPGVGERHARDRPRRIVDHEEIQVAVAIVVEEHRLGGVARVRDAVGGRLLHERRHPVRVHALVDVQLVGPEPAVAETGVADVNVEPPVAVHVGEGDAGGPSLVPQAGLLGDIAEAELALVEIQPRPAQIRGQHDLGEPVARQVAERRPAAIVVVAVGEDVQLAGVGEAILEADAGVTGGEPGEQPAVGRRERGIRACGAAGEQAEYGHEKR